ncbi:hypothetical protein GCM10010359_01830 [Streptomyces morookaense]|nr:hypothetical protein GCM10010359_01830 [Streptomyces morookaense]
MTADHTALVDLAPRLLTRHHAYHYRGFARTQWRLFGKSGELKPLLYTFRVLLTGIHLMRTHEVRADLPTLLDNVRAPDCIRDLVAAKVGRRPFGQRAKVRGPRSCRTRTGCCGSPGHRAGPVDGRQRYVAVAPPA